MIKRLLQTKMFTSLQKRLLLFALMFASLQIRLHVGVKGFLVDMIFRFTLMFTCLHFC